MTNRRTSLTVLGCVLAIGLYALLPVAISGQEAPSQVGLVSNRVSLAGTSNIHAYTASSTAARITRLQIASDEDDANLWDAIVNPGTLQAFEISIPAATLSSPREGLDKNMHKALKVTEHPEIVFRLVRLEGTPDALRGIGILRVAGVEREVTLALKTSRTDATFTVCGEVQLLMTDFGITPPKAMLGMLKTDPKVTVTFETVLGIPLN